MLLGHISSSHVRHVLPTPSTAVDTPTSSPPASAKGTIGTEMGKRRVLPPGLEKKPTKRTGKNGPGFSETGLGKYLKADSHLHAPLVDRLPSHPSPFMTIHSLVTGE